MNTDCPGLARPDHEDEEVIVVDGSADVDVVHSDGESFGSLFDESSLLMGGPGYGLL